MWPRAQVVCAGSEVVNRPDADRPHEVFNLLTVGPAGAWALSAGEPNVLLRDGRDCVEGRAARRQRVGFNQRCGTGIRRVSMSLFDLPARRPYPTT